MNIVGIKKSTRNISNFLLDLIFPQKCVNCREFGSFCCQKCLEKIKPIQTQVCPKCGKISDRGQFCESCKNDSNLTGLIVGATYRIGPTKELIHHLKYNSILEFAPILADLLIDQLIDADFRGQVVITPVPLHRRRQNERGFNQAEIIAKLTAKKIGYDYQNLLIRKKYSDPQVQSTGKKRRENLLDAFAPAKSVSIKNKTIILVDDVSTTGATLEECAKVLRLAGARQVWGLVVAKG